MKKILKILREGLPPFQHFWSQNGAWMVPAFLAVLGGLILWAGVARYKQRLGYGMETQKVLVARQSLSEGSNLRTEDMGWVQIPTRFIPTGVFQYSERSRLLGRTLHRNLDRGEIIFSSFLKKRKKVETPSLAIPKGYRALAVRVDPVTSVAQGIRAGDRVDLVTTISPPGTRQPRTVTVLQNVAVLNVGSPMSSQERSTYVTVTLKVLPKEVPLISFAQQNGRLSFVLRNPKDDETPRDLPIVGLARLFETAFRNSIQQERDFSIEVIRAGKTSFEFLLP